MEEYRPKLHRRGRKHSEETKRKIGLANRGKRRSPETIEKLSTSHLGHHPTSETREKLRKISQDFYASAPEEIHQILREAGKRSWSTPERRAKHMAALKTRHPHSPSEETRHKISAAKKGKPHGPMSDETKAKISLANSGKKRSPEIREAMSLRQRGIRPTPETIAKQSMAMVEYHASMSPEEKARRSAQMSIATKERIAAGTTNEIRYGWKHTEETKAKISARRRTWFANLTPEEKSAYMDDAHAAARRANDERFEQTGHRMPEESRLAVGAGRRTWMQTPEAKKKFFRFTAPERAFAQELEAAGTPYKWQFSAAGHIWDFFIPPNTVVDVDGCFWHGCPIHRPGCGKPDQQERDARAVVDAAAAGYKPQRIWEHELISYAATKVSK